MQEFLTNNTVSCNLMSLTGYRTLVIFKLLMDSPKSNDEINDYFLNHQYIKEKFSNDTLRLYINSLRAIGCEITRADKSNNKKYRLISHPFKYDINKNQIKTLIKLYKFFYDKVEISELIAIKKLFEKITDLVEDSSIKVLLENNSMLKNIDLNILEALILYCKKKNQITFLYNSQKSGEKKIELIADKLSFNSEKLYLWGYYLNKKEYSYLKVEKISEICSVKLVKNKTEPNQFKITYELFNHSDKYIPTETEKIIEKSEHKLIIEAVSKNKFSLMQKVLSLGEDCKIIKPESFKIELVNKLKMMRINYEKIQ